MDRRDVLRSALSAATVTGAFGVGSVRASQPQRGRPRPDSPYINTRDGQQLFFKDWGSGAPILFLSAWALPSDMWDYQMVSLSGEGLRCVAYDRRGHGRSSRPGDGYDYDTLADDLAAVLDRLDLRGVTLVGMSMASGEMVRYVTRHGTDRLARLVFVSAAATPFRTRTSDNPGGTPAEQLDYFRRTVLLHDYPKWLDDNRRPFFVPETSPQMQDWVKMLMLGTSMKALVECSRSMSATDFRAELPKIKLPSLLIHGDQDVSAPIDLTGRPTAKLIPGAELKVYEGAPHGLFLTHMDRLSGDIRAFASA
jgi:non-heme chloroperoxidase